MELIELSAVPGAALPVAAFRQHLRLGTGFADDASQDGLLEALLRAALAGIEGRIAKVLLNRSYRLRLARWRNGTAQPLPLAPVRVIAQVVMQDRNGHEVPVDPGRWRLEPDAHRPQLVATGYLLPGVPSGGAVLIDFEAGFGADWADVPPDLAQAVFLLAAQYYEQRAEGQGQAGPMPFGVLTLIERWRRVRSFGSGA